MMSAPTIPVLEPASTANPVLSFDGDLETNAELIVAAARLGYLRSEWRTLDATWGVGTFWSLWRPDVLVATDRNPAKSPTGQSVDFTDLPFESRSFRAAVLDPPYKLNGTPTEKVDDRYGVADDEWVGVPVAERHDLILRGITENARVLAYGGLFLLKCKDQVCNGENYWQTDIFTTHAASLGLVKIDVLLFPSYRKQPEAGPGSRRQEPAGDALFDLPSEAVVQAPRRQVHSHRNYSTLLVFRNENLDQGALF